MTNLGSKTPKRARTVVFLCSVESKCRGIVTDLQALGYQVREVTSGSVLYGQDEMLGQPDLILVELEACGEILFRSSPSGRFQRSLLKRLGSQVEAVASRLQERFDCPLLAVTSNTSAVNIGELTRVGFLNCLPRGISRNRLRHFVKTAMLWNTLEESQPLQTLRSDWIGEYQILEKLGEGASGVVYKAKKPDSAHVVALKLLKRECADFDEIMRFRREIAALGTVNHPNIVNFIESGVHKGCYYYVMTFVMGQDLADYSLQIGRFSERRVIRLLDPLASALGALHAKNFIHRDIKPVNILMADHTPVLTDFGIVRNVNDRHVTQSGVVVGTPGYIAPELIRGEQPSPQSDLFSLGMLATELLSGCDQFPPSMPVVSLMGCILGGHYKRPSVFLRSHSRLASVLDRLVELDPKKRWSNAEDFRRALEWARSSADSGIFEPVKA